MKFDYSAPIYLQIIRTLEEEIVSGSIKKGQKLPSGRDLALRFTVNPNTANRVYTEMEREGLCETRRGLGTFVTEDEERIRELRETLARELAEGFLGGMRRLGMTEHEIREMLDRELSGRKEG